MEGKEINLTLPIVYSVDEQKIIQLKQKYAVLPTDLEVKENYTFIKEGIAKIRKCRSEVEQRRKELKKDALEYGRNVDFVAKEIKKRLLAIETPMKQLKTDFDTKKEIERREKIRKEEERLEKIHEGIAGIKTLIDVGISQKSTEIQTAISQLENNNVEDWAQEFTEKALEAKKNTLAKLNELYSMKLQSEQAEEERRKREEERKKREEEDRKAALKLAEENKRREAELAEQQRQIEAQKKALAEQQRQIEAEKRKAEQERLKAEKLKKEKEEAERRKKEQERLKAERLKKEKEEAEKRKKLDQEYFYQTIDIILPYVKSKKAGTTLLNEVRSNKIAHLRWV